MSERVADAASGPSEAADGSRGPAPALPPLRSLIPVTLLAIAYGMLAFSLGELNGLLLGIVIVGGLVCFWAVEADRSVVRALDAGEIEILRDPKIVGLLARLAREAGVAPPRICLMKCDEPAAWMLGVNPSRSSIVVTSALLVALTKKELAGVLAHELAHIRSRDSVVLMTLWAILETIAAAALVLAYIVRAVGLGRSLVGWLLTGFNGIVLLVGCAMMRDREYEADHLGAAICGDPDWMIAALRKLQRLQRRPGSKPGEVAEIALGSSLILGRGDIRGVGRLSSHPPIASRIDRLQRLQARLRGGYGSSSEAGRSEPGPSSS